ncbi:MAG TPA: TIGR03000 domain-containing protein, partial [Gemmataceae bacterium]|nr:TIGR03000 domain-containing protein [Gemmataceae bacterium]
AKLTIDGNATTSTSSRRIFTSPTLQMGQEYVYTLRAEIIREGRTVAETQQVTVRAGEETPVQFSMSTQGVAVR